jgi:chromosome segregation ATPase
MVQKDAFDMEGLKDGFMKVEVVVDKPEGIDRFSKNYESIVGAVSSKMEEVGAKRAAIRTEETKEDAQSRLDDAQAKLDEAQAQLEKGRAELDEGWSKIEEGKKQIEENEAKLTEGQGQLMTSQVQLMEGRDKLAEGEVKLAKAEVELSLGKSVLDVGREQLDNARKALIDSWNMKEDAVEGFRNDLRSALGSAGEDIRWASRRSVNIDSSRATAMKIDITDTLSFDLNKSLKTNVRALLDSGLISDEAMITLYLALTGGGT